MIRRLLVMVGAVLGVIAVLAWGNVPLTVWEAVLVGIAAVLVGTLVVERG